MSGLELVAHARAAHPDLKFVVISAFATQKSRDELQKHLVDAILSKPEGLAELPEVAPKIIARKRQRRRHPSHPNEHLPHLQVAVEKCGGWRLL